MPKDKPELSPHLDITDPSKWHEQIRLYVSDLSTYDAERWIEEFRICQTLAGRIIRDQVYTRGAGRCGVCDKPFKEGKPAGEEGYYDAERNYIKIYFCDPSEMGDAKKIAKTRTDEVAEAEDRADKASRKAVVAARQSHRPPASTPVSST